MTGRTRLLGCAFALLLACSSPGPIWAAQPPKATLPALDVERITAEAEAAEQAGKWDKALDFYIKLYTNGHGTPELRDRIRFCLRNLNQLDRHRDVAFQQFVLSLTPSDALNLYVEVIGKIHTLYADRDRSTPDKLFAAGLQELDRALGSPSFRQAYLTDVSEVKIARFREVIRDGWLQKLPANPREVRLAAREVITSAQTQLGVKNGSAILLELLCGACAGLDEYSGYRAPGAGSSELASPLLELVAFGLYVSLQPRGLLVENVRSGSWAALHTSIRKGDRIVQINGKDLTKPAPSLLAESLKTPSTTAGHEIEVQPTDAHSNSYKLRLPLPIPSVFGADLIHSKEGIGYVRVAVFKDSTLRELGEAIEHLKGRGLRALVIDLRGNPGGSFAAAIELAKRFLAIGVVATTTGQIPEFANGIFQSDSGMSALDLPVVLLVDSKTMSAAEVFAAGLKDNQRATLIGQTTFGKGLIQCPVKLKALDGDDPRGSKSGSLVLSVGAVASPRGTTLNGTGIAPHIVESDPTRQLELAIERLSEILQSGLMMMPAEMMR